MDVDEQGLKLLLDLADLGIEFIVVGGAAAVLQGAPVVTQDIDIVPRREPDNATKLHDFLQSIHAYHRDLTNRRLPPRRELLLGHGHLLFSTDLGPFDVLCELGIGEGYEQLIDDSPQVEIAGRQVHVLGLSRLIAVKTAANRAKDRMVLPLLIATLEEKQRK
jgi:hypothetical protein